MTRGHGDPPGPLPAEVLLAADPYLALAYGDLAAWSAAFDRACECEALCRCPHNQPATAT